MKRGTWSLAEYKNGFREPGTYALYDGSVWQCEIKAGELGDVLKLLEWAQKREQRRAERSRGSR